MTDNLLRCLAKNFFAIPYPASLNRIYDRRVLSWEGSLSRGDPDIGQSESWPGRGPPERPTRLVAKGGAPGGAAPYVTGRARSRCTARGGYVIPASKGCLTQHPWRLPPLHRPRGLRGDRQSSDALRRENAKPRPRHSGAGPI